MSYDETRYPNNPAVKIDENTYVFGIQHYGNVEMVAVDLTGINIQTRWLESTSDVVTEEIWEKGAIGGYYTAEDVSFDCGKAIS